MRYTDKHRRQNRNIIIENGFSNPETSHLYDKIAAGKHSLSQRYSSGIQCGGCSFFAPLNSDYGICCLKKSQHYLETIFEHFVCEAQIEESWEYHTFTDNLKSKTKMIPPK